MINNIGKIEKGWGYEEIFVSNLEYCGKFLVFNRAGAKFSMHFHAKKKETWHVLSGKFILRWIDTEDAEVHEKSLLPGSTWTNNTFVPHQLICIEPGRILEVSTPDNKTDNYRVEAGDSQYGG
jgi:mannose-6-phosphate isomerase-like protein (cupin superfamily)